MTDPAFPPSDKTRLVIDRMRLLATFEAMVQEGIEWLHGLTADVCAQLSAHLDGPDGSAPVVSKPSHGVWDVEFRGRALVTFRVTPGTRPAAEAIVATCGVERAGVESGRCVLVKVNVTADWRRADGTPVTGEWILERIDDAVRSELRIYPTSNTRLSP